MNVVRHETVGPDAAPGPARGLAEEVAVELLIGVLEEGLLAAIAALGDVIGNAGQDDAGETGQGQSPDRAATA